MADNTTLDPGSGGDTIATDDIGGVKYERVKLTDGTADSTTAIAAGGGVESGALRVTVASDSTGVLSVDDNGSSLTVDNGGTFAVQIAANSSVNVAQVAGTTTDTNSGTKSAGTQRVVLATDQPQLTNALKVDGSAVTQPVSGTVTANLGTAAVTNAGTFAVQDSEKIADDAAFTVATTKLMPIGFLADQASTDSVNEGDIGAARITLDRKLIVTLAPSADTEGLTALQNLDIDESEDDVKTSAGKLYGWFLYNDGASEVYVKFYNATAASTTVGSTTPLMTIPIPAGSASNVEWSHGIAFSTAICVAATTAAAVADTGAPATNQVVGTILYQ